MKRLLLLAGAIWALTLTNAPAQATPVSATANAQVKIYRPLTITNNTALDFATVVLGTGTYTDTITLSTAGVITCGTHVTCSGTPAAAKFTVTGTSNAVAAITLPSSTGILTGSNGGTVTVTLSAPATLALGSTGSTTGASFFVGGSFPVSNTTTDGLYTGQFTVNADYQ